MHYENRQPPEGINVTPHNPVKQLLVLLAGAVIIVMLAVLLLQVGGAWLAKQIPFRFEQRVMQELQVPFGTPDAPAGLTDYLDDLAARLVAQMHLPEGMSVTVHYSDENTINAFATIGGNLLLYRGLLSRMPTENALAMVMAHEIAHVLHRDPVAGLGGGVAGSLAVLVLTGSNTGLAGQVLQSTGGVTSLSFTRRMETSADQAAVTALGRLYGHLNGADTFFRMISALHDASSRPDWVSRFTQTHPLDGDRIRAIADQAQAEGWPLEGELTPLPDAWRDWLGEHED